MFHGGAGRINHELRAGVAGSLEYMGCALHIDESRTMIERLVSLKRSDESDGMEDCERQG